MAIFKFIENFNRPLKILVTSNVLKSLFRRNHCRKRGFVPQDFNNVTLIIYNYYPNIFSKLKSSETKKAKVKTMKKSEFCY